MEWFTNPTTPAEKIIAVFIAIILFAVVMGGIVFAVDRNKIKNWVVVTGFLAPIGAILAIGLVYPALKTLWGSFHILAQSKNADGSLIRDPITKKVLSTQNFSLDNYQVVFTDSGMLRTLLNTALWTILVPLFATVIGLVYAVIIDRTRFEKFAKALIFLPMAISMVGASIIWRFVYSYTQTGNQIGLANQFLVWLGFEPISFLTSAGNTYFMIIIMIWIQAGFAMTILSAAIKAIPDDVIEAAKIDGATGMKLFTSITIPSIRPALVVVLTTIAISSLKAYDIVQTLASTQERARVIATEFMRLRANSNTEGQAAALAVILFVIVIPIVVYNVRQMKASEGIR